MRFDLPNPDDARILRRLSRVNGAFRSVSTSMPCSYVAAYLAVALKPGLGVTDYGNAIGIVQPIMSRILLEIGQKSRNGGEGLGLLDSRRDPTDFRQHQVFLTPKGKMLLNQILNNMRD